jgi:uncharacterized protein (DUF433 family)
LNPSKNTPEIGSGVYSVPDAADILGFPIDKIRRWIKSYWENKFADDGTPYTWGEGRDRGFNFYTLVELIAIYALRENNVSFKKIIEARSHLKDTLNVEYPFATKKVMSDGEKFFYQIDQELLLDVNLKNQYSFKDIVEPYCNKLDFDAIDTLAERFWPLGKDRNVVVDPKHRFGEPTISGTNIAVDIIAGMASKGEKISKIAKLYDLTEDQVTDAIEFKNGPRIAA